MLYNAIQGVRIFFACRLDRNLVDFLDDKTMTMCDLPQDIVKIKNLNFSFIIQCHIAKDIFFLNDNIASKAH